jgi:MFS family permease
MILTILSVALVPVSALVIPWFQQALPRGLFYTLFAVVFVLGGLATGSARIVNANMLLAIAPAASRATYVGFLNTVLGFVSVLAVIGGLIVDTVGYIWLFAVAIVFAVLALVSSARMSARPAY